jgi:hypothetical protein
MVRAHVGHDFRSRQDLGMELVFELVELLVAVSLVLVLSRLETCPLIVVHLHDGGR